MNRKYLAKIIAKDNHGLKLISAYCFDANVKIKELKFLKRNKIFLLFLQRYSHEDKKKVEKINSVCKFEFVESVKAQSINQANENLVLELFSIDSEKNNEKFNINLTFTNNSCITLCAEIIEVTLEDQNKI